MKQLRLIRIETNYSSGTFGVLLIDGKSFCVTLEPYSRDNTKMVSCIPMGQYTMKPKNSKKYGKVYIVEKVQNRSGILFHIGNTKKDTKGCILPGQSFGTLGKNRAILNSTETMRRLLIRLNNEVCNLSIIECY